MNLLVNQLKLAIRELLEKKGIQASVRDTVNPRGQIVIGIILSKPP